MLASFYSNFSPLLDSNCILYFLCFRYDLAQHLVTSWQTTANHTNETPNIVPKPPRPLISDLGHKDDGPDRPRDFALEAVGYGGGRGGLVYGSCIAHSSPVEG